MENSINNSNNPFAGCALGRERYGNALTKLVSDNLDGNVIALNNRWGAGKTTFVKMWRELLEQKGTKTIYFNAWESDFEDNPLSALMAELKSVLRPSENFDNLLKYGGNILLNVASNLGTKFIERHIGEGTVGDVARIVTGQAKDIFEEEISEYINTKDSIQKFRNALKNYIQQDCDKIPLIFFVDELDRCRPSYAVKVLETIKHIFSVPNITFVLSIDKDQLGYAVQGFYGSDKIDTKEYLRRFIDIEFTLPAPDMDKYYNFLFKKFKIWEIAASEYNYNGIEALKQPMQYLFKDFTLRQMDKVCSHISLIMNASRVQARSFRVLIFLIYLRYNDEKLYDRIRFTKISIQELPKILNDIYLEMPTSRIPDGQRLMSSLEADLLYVYDNYQRQKRIGSTPFYSYGSVEGFNSTVVSMIDNDNFKKNLSELARMSDYEPQDFETILDMIELCPI